MDDDKQLPVTVTASKKTAAAARPPLPSAVLLVSVWALLTACCAPFAVALGFILHCFHVQCKPSSITMRCIDLTDAEAAKLAALWNVLLWCSAVQAAAAVLALLLPRHRRGVRHSLAFVALAAAALGHCANAANVHLILAADPGYLFLWICGTAVIFGLAVGDIVNFVALLVGSLGGDECVVPAGSSNMQLATTC